MPLPRNRCKTSSAAQASRLLHCGVGCRATPPPFKTQPQLHWLPNTTICALHQLHLLCTTNHTEKHPQTWATPGSRPLGLCPEAQQATANTPSKHQQHDMRGSGPWGHNSPQGTTRASRGRLEKTGSSTCPLSGGQAVLLLLRHNCCTGALLSSCLLPLLPPGRCRWLVGPLSCWQDGGRYQTAWGEHSNGRATALLSQWVSCKW